MTSVNITIQQLDLCPYILKIKEVYFLPKPVFMDMGLE